MGEFIERDRVLMVADLANFTTSIAHLDDRAIAELLDDWLTRATNEVTGDNGEVIKYLGDGLLAAFDDDAATTATECALRVREGARQVGEEHGIDLDCGMSVHRATVIDCRFGPDELRDLTGRGVFHCFRMGRGPGIRISEAVYRQLPNELRAGWSKTRPPATYHWRDGLSSS